MFYEEAIVDGVLSCRYTPDTPMHPLSPEDLTARIVNLEHKLLELRRDPRLQIDVSNIEVMKYAINNLIDDYGEVNDEVLEMQDLLLQLDLPEQSVTQPGLFQDFPELRA